MKYIIYFDWSGLGRTQSMKILATHKLFGASMHKKFLPSKVYDQRAMNGVTFVLAYRATLVFTSSYMKTACFTSVLS